jgi:DNA polymerase-3 subunit chi
MAKEREGYILTVVDINGDAHTTEIKGYYAESMADMFFANATLDDARLAWKLLAGREGVERRYWAQEGGKWAKKA